MSKTKKVLSVILAVVMAFGVFSICAFAATETATFALTVKDSTNTTAVTSVNVDDVVTVNVALTTDYFTGAIGIPVHFDSAAFEYVADSAVLADVYDGAASASVSATYADFNPVKATGVVFASFVPMSNAAGVTAPKLSGMVVLTFQLKAIAATAAASNNIYIDANDQKTSTNAGGLLYCGSHATADVYSDETVTGQTMVLTNAAAKVVVNAAGGADPVLTGVDTGVVDGTNMYVYGVPAGTSTADFGNYFTVSNGTFEVSGNGTGATLTVKTTGGAVFATYILVIFGDVNGDGAVALADYVALLSALAGSGVSGAVAVASDVNGSGSVSAPDAGLADYVALLSALAGAGYTNVNPFAA